MESQQGSYRLALLPRLCWGCCANWHLVPCDFATAQGMAAGYDGVWVWAGCLCFWVLGPGLVVSTAEIAASGRAVGFCGVVGLHNQGGPVVYLKGMDNFWLFLPSCSLVTMAAGMLRKSVSTQLPLQMRTRGRKLGAVQAEEFELTAVCGGHTVCPALFWALGIQQRANEQRSLPWRNLHLNVKRQMANNKQDKPVGWCVRRLFETTKTWSMGRRPRALE